MPSGSGVKDNPETLVQISPKTKYVVEDSRRAAQESDAGEFGEWLRTTEAQLGPRTSSSVPCGTCTACCRSSMFVYIAPHESRTLQRIPSALLFPAPGLPKGHFVLGYTENGHCPMLIDDRCSIYDDRPETCRSYDCRVFTATRLAPERHQTEIAERVRAWRFTYSNSRSEEEHASISEAAAFLQRHRDLFPRGVVPEYPAQLAALTLRVYRLLHEMCRGADALMVPDSYIVRRIVEKLALLQEPGAQSRRVRGRCKGKGT